MTDEYFAFLKSYRAAMEREDDFLQAYERQLLALEEGFRKKESGGLLEKEEIARHARLLQLLKDGRPDAQPSAEASFEAARIPFEKQRQKLEECEDAAKAALEYAFDFMEEAFAAGEEMVVFVTELAVSREASSFLAENACERYLKYNRQLLIAGRKGELLSELRREIAT